MNIIMGIWDFFAANILTQPAYFIGLIVFIGYLLYMKHFQDLSRRPLDI